jgi:hypothetical protein
MPIPGDPVWVCGIIIGTFLLEYDNNHYIIMLNGEEKIIPIVECDFNLGIYLTEVNGLHTERHANDPISEKTLQAR